MSRANITTASTRHLGRLGMSLFGMCMLALTSPVYAVWQTYLPESDLSLRMSGFGTAGVAFSDADGIGFRRDTGKNTVVLKDDPNFRTDSLIGLQLNLLYKQKLGGALQFKLQDQAETDVNDYVHTAFLSYQVNPSLTVRGGLLPIDAFMLSENKEISYTYPWVRPEVNFYSLLILNNFKGVDLSYRHPMGSGLVDWRLGGGSFSSNSAVTRKAMTHIAFDDFYNGSVSYEINSFTTRASVLLAKVEEIAFIEGLGDLARKYIKAAPKLPIEGARFLRDTGMAGADVSLYALGAAYDNGRWLVQSEVSHTNYKSSSDLQLDSGYLSVAYRVDHLTPYAVVSRMYSSGRKGISSFIASIDPAIADDVNEVVAIASRRANQSTFSAGLRWDIHSNIALKAQWDHHRLGQYGIFGWLSIDGEVPERHVNTVTFSMDFVF